MTGSNEMRTLPDCVGFGRASAVQGPAAFRQRTAGRSVYKQEVSELVFAGQENGRDGSVRLRDNPQRLP